MTTEERNDALARPLITVDVAGEVLGIGKNRAYRAAKDGQIPTIRLGRRLHVPTAELRKLLGIETSKAA